MAPIIAYAARTGTKRNLDALRVRGWRLLVSATGVHRTEGFDHIGLDNGAWTAYQRFLKGLAPTPLLDKRAFIRLVLSLGSIADWAVACDIVNGGAESLALSLRWIPWVLKHCRRALLAVQDGMTVAQIRPHLGADVGVFVGGATRSRSARCATGRHSRASAKRSATSAASIPSVASACVPQLVSPASTDPGSAGTPSRSQPFIARLFSSR